MTDEAPYLSLLKDTAKAVARSTSLEDALALAGFASVEALVQWCATADPSEVEALGIWLAGVMGGGAQ